MHRRKFVQTSLASIAGIGIATAARAALVNLGPVPTQFGPAMAQRAFVQQPVRLMQQCPEWCWAASCAMIFSMFNHPMDQMQIVQKVFGGTICAPAPAGIVMAEVLSDSWTDMSGTPFSSQLTAAFDAQAGVSAMNNAIIVNELADNRPVLYANTHHAMVIVSADFVQTPAGVNISAVGVLDPWPPSPAYHQLSQPELFPVEVPGGQMMFQASVSVS
jgi:hypothetical protein